MADLTLHLGVIDVPYVRAPSRRQRKVKPWTVTTGNVAEWLERRYHIMETFVAQHEQDIAAALESSLSGALESLLMGAPIAHDAFGSATSAIEDRMKQFIAMGEMDSLGVAGVPTMAARARRRPAAVVAVKRRRATGAKAVSFYDTGLYQNVDARVGGLTMFVNRAVAMAAPTRHQFIQGVGYLPHAGPPDIPAPAAKPRPCAPPALTLDGSVHMLEAPQGGTQIEMRWNAEHKAWASVSGRGNRLAWTPEHLSQAGWAYAGPVRIMKPAKKAR